MKERDVARHALFPIASAFGAFLLATGWPLTPRRHSPFGKDKRDPFNRPHSRAVVEIASNTLLREVFSAKFHLAEALLYKTASPGKHPLHRYIRVLLPCQPQVGIQLFSGSFAQDYGSRLLTLRQNFRVFRCRLFLGFVSRVQRLPR
jgi:hypothetical protein